MQARVARRGSVPASAPAPTNPRLVPGSDRASAPGPESGRPANATVDRPASSSSPANEPLTPDALRRFQVSAGNRATSHLIAQRQAATVQRVLAEAQADAIARRLEDAMSGWGTDEEAIYGALSGRTGADLTAIRTSYQKLFSEDLDAELADELTDSELERVKQMMPPTADESSLSDKEKTKAAGDRAAVIATQLRDAIEGAGTEEDQIYGALSGRTNAELNEIQKAYVKLTGRDLVMDLRGDMSRGELREALNLLQVASAGTFENEITQKMTEGKTTGGKGMYDYALHSDRLDVSVPVHFVPLKGVNPPFALWNSQIDAVWNKFAVVGDAGKFRIPINMAFKDEPSADREIEVHPDSKDKTEDRANAGKYFVTMKPETVPHEFGHLLGLQDEYQRYHDDFKALTGYTKVGPKNESGETEEDIASDLFDAFHLEDKAKRGAAVTKVLDRVGLIVKGVPQQGDFALAVMAAYDQAYGKSRTLVETMRDDLVKKDKWAIQTVFSYASRTIMGDPRGLKGTDPHDHSVEPRHLRSMVRIVEDAWPDHSWRVGPR